MITHCLPVHEMPFSKSAGIGKASGHSGGSSHQRTDEVGASPLALASLEVAVAGGGAALSGLEHVIIHGEAH